MRKIPSEAFRNQILAMALLHASPPNLCLLCHRITMTIIIRVSFIYNPLRRKFLELAMNLLSRAKVLTSRRAGI